MTKKAYSEILNCVLNTNLFIHSYARPVIFQLYDLESNQSIIRGNAALYWGYGEDWMR